MAFAPALIAVAGGLAAGTWVGIAAAALSVAGFATGNKTLSMIGGLIGLAGGVAGMAGAASGGAIAGAEGAVGATGAAEAGAAAAEAVASTDFAGAVQSGADATQLSSNVASVTGDTLGNAVLADQGATLADPGGGSIGSDLPGTTTPGSPAQAGLQEPSQFMSNAMAEPSALPGQSPLTEQPGLTPRTGILQPANETGAMDMFGNKAPGPGGVELPLGPGQSAAAGGTANAADQGVISKILDLFNSQGDVTKAGIIKMLGEGVAKGFSRNPNAEFVDLQKDKFAAEQAEADRRKTNANNIPEIRMNVRPNRNANLYPNGQYQPVGILQARRA